MKTAFGTIILTGKRLAVFLLALLLLIPQILAAPSQPEVKLTHTGDGNRVVLECTADVAAPDGENEYRVAMTLSVQADAGVVIDPNSVQAVYRSEDGETVTLDGNNWSVDQNKGLVVTALDVDTDMGGQLMCRVTGRLSAGAGGKLVNTAELAVEYQDLVEGSLTQTSASARDEIQRVLSYSLTLDLNGGSLSGKKSNFVWREDLSQGQQVSLGDLPKPSRSGYFFDGWTLAAGSGAKLESNALIMGSGNATLRAVWTSMADKLTLDLNGGSGRLVTIDGTTGEDVTLPFPADVLYSRDGYKLGGWSTTPDGQNGRIYKGGESYTLTREEDILYAWWAPQYTLSYDANGGTGNMPRRIFAASDPAVISENAFTRSGYNFTGWCVSADGRGALYQSGDTLELTGDTTLYAQWEKIYETPAEEEQGNSHMPILLGILAALVVIGGVCGLVIWKRRQDGDDPYDDGPYDDGDYDDGYEDRFDDQDGYTRRRDRYDGRDGYDSRRDRYDGRDDYDRRDRYDRDPYDRHGDRYDGRTEDRYDDRRERRRHDRERDRYDD